MSNSILGIIIIEIIYFYLCQYVIKINKDSKVQVTVLQQTWKGLQAKRDYSSAPSLHPEMDTERQENCKKQSQTK